MPKTRTGTRNRKSRDSNQFIVDDQVVIYDAKHPELYPDTSNRPDIIEIGIEANWPSEQANHETTPYDHLAAAPDAYQRPSAFWIAERVREFCASPAPNWALKTW